MPTNLNNTTLSNNLYAIASGSSSSNPFVDFFSQRDPTSHDTNFPVQKRWFNTVNGKYWYLSGFSTIGGVTTAVWLYFSVVPGQIDQITTPDSNICLPVNGNINFQQTGSINITSSGNNILFDVIGGEFDWYTIAAASANMVADSGYIANFGSLVTLTLPTVAVVGDAISVVGKGAGGWIIDQNANQTIYFGNAKTTTGTGGSLSSTAQRDTVTFVCITADLDNIEFEVLSSIGNLTYV